MSNRQTVHKFDALEQLMFEQVDADEEATFQYVSYYRKLIAPPVKHFYQITQLANVIPV